MSAPGTIKDAIILLVAVSNAIQPVLDRIEGNVIKNIAFEATLMAARGSARLLHRLHSV